MVVDGGRNTSSITVHTLLCVIAETTVLFFILMIDTVVKFCVVVLFVLTINLCYFWSKLDGSSRGHQFQHQLLIHIDLTLIIKRRVEWSKDLRARSRILQNRVLGAL